MVSNFPFFGLNKKVLALAPMDGFTDCAFREIVKKYGNPDLLFTEFVNAQGLLRAPDRLIETLRYTESQRPIIAQIFGKDPRYFIEATRVVCSLGFDGVDINMGCPAKNIASKGGGAALISSPDLALEIIRAVKEGVDSYRKKGSSLSDLIDMEEKTDLEKLVENTIRKWNITVIPEREITVSVKTRIGYDKDTSKEWIGKLNEAKPDFISLHGRTFRQRYKGRADWSAIENAAEVSSVPIIGNGDIRGSTDITKRRKTCAGVMIGRGAVGKPWIFKDNKSEIRNPKLNDIALEHSKLYVKYKGEQRFYEMRKHLLKYFKGFKGSKDMRKKLSTINSLEELKKVLI